MLKILLTVITSLVFCASGFCTQLPEPVADFVKEKFPEAKIRFDGLIELPDKTGYLPVLPLVNNNPGEQVQVVQTIPSGQDFSQKPDMILFSNNLALLKIIKKQGEPPTVISSPEIPLKVKLGILPQDLVVPKGLVLSPELKVILGDLKIPLKEKIDRKGEIAFYNKTEKNSTEAEKPVNLEGKTTENVFRLPELEFLSEKKLYTINHRDNKLYVLNSATGRVSKAINLPSVPAGITITPDSRYILLSGPVAEKIFVIDTLNDKFIKSISTGGFPSSIVSGLREQKAYVANKYSGTVSKIDLKNMRVQKQIPVSGYPDNLHISENKNFVFYNDYRTGNVYSLNIKTEKTGYLFNDKNIAKISRSGRYIFSLSRSENTLTVFDLKKNEVITKTKTGEKPVDFEILEKMGKIIVACAGTNELNIIDTENFGVIKNIPLKNNGFPGRIELVQETGGKTRALITDFDSYEVVIYDVDMEKILGHLPVSRIVGSIIISNKKVN